MNSNSANTVEQYKILKYIEKNFNLDSITIELISSFEVKVSDINKDQLIFMLKDNLVKWKEVEQ